VPPVPLIQEILDGRFDLGSAEIYDATNNLLAQLTFGSPATNSGNLVSDTEIGLPPLGGYVYRDGTPTRMRVRKPGNASTYDLVVGTGAAADNKVVVTTGTTWLTAQRISATSLFASVPVSSYIFRGALTLETPSEAVTLPELPRDVPNWDALDFSSAPVYTAAVGETMASAAANAIALMTGPVPMAVCKLRAGATYTENFVGTNYGANGWLKFTTTGSKPTSGSRVTPNDATTYGFPKLVAAYDYAPAISFAIGARGYMFEALEVTCNPIESTYPLIYTGRDASTNPTLADIPARISIRQCYIHGFDAHFSRIRGVEMNASLVEVVDCWVSKINYGGVSYSPQDQSLQCNSSLGRHRIEHNFLWGCVESIAYGGAGQFSSVVAEQLMMSDIVIRRNHTYMPKNLQGIEGMANCFEFKNGRRILIEQNVCEFRPLDLQNGYSTVTWSVNQSGGPNEEWVQVCDVTIRYNWFKNTNSAFDVAGVSGTPAPLWPRRFHIHNNLFTGLASPFTYNAAGLSSGWGLLLSPKVRDLLIENNTIVPVTAGIALGSHDEALLFSRFAIKNNIIEAYYFILDDGVANGPPAWTGGTDASCEFTGNVCFDSSGNSAIPEALVNTVVASRAAIGFADPTVFDRNNVLLSELTQAVVSGANAGKGCNVTSLISQLADVPADYTLLSSLYGDAAPPPPPPPPAPPVLTTLVLAPTSLSLFIENSAQLIVTGLDQYGAPISLGTLTVSVSNASVSATISGAIVTVTGVSAGTSTVSVTSGAIQSNSASVTVQPVVVNDPAVLTSLIIAPSQVNVQKGRYTIINIGAFDQRGEPMAIPSLTISSTNSNVAVISTIAGSQGQVAGVAKGNCYVWVSGGAITSNRTHVTVSDMPPGKYKTKMNWNPF
jgi:hypothetical protein